ncbi:hypothetical protein QBC32DRAFT_184295, partial [Pseudoneurospora amorphoporcata]
QHQVKYHEAPVLHQQTISKPCSLERIKAAINGRPRDESYGIKPISGCLGPQVPKVGRTRLNLAFS